MARKNILAGLMDESKKFTAVNSETAQAEKPTSSLKGIGALGAVTRSIDALAAKADAARAIEEKLAEGQTVVELEPAVIEDSFVSDRLQQDDEAFRELVDAIRARGQDSPILVRPHPKRDGFYQVVFGHRRLRAAKHLGLPVRAVVKRLDDRDHVIAQGQENSARADLSFIERTMFARRLDDLGFDRETIIAALASDKTTISKMLSVTRRIPEDILATIDAARSVGRDRWHDLSTRLEDTDLVERLRKAIAQASYVDAGPEQRFETLEKLARRKATATGDAARKPETRAWQRSGRVRAKIKDDGKQFTLALRDRNAAAFGAYIEDNLDKLYEAFEKQQNVNINGD